MLSKGGKIIYSCPNCNSENINKQPYKPAYKFIGANTGICNSCNSWWPWSSRIKTSVRKLGENK